MNEKTITIPCRAKINLSLDVIRRRSDGYHDVELIFAETALSDTLTVTLYKSSSERAAVTLFCDDPTLPTDSGNIAYRAARAILNETNTDYCAEITLKKQIPHGAGLGGGSADAAGVLNGINSILKNPVDRRRLLEIGMALGADVPFCLIGGCAFAEGIGEILTPLPTPDFSYVIVKPEQSISTAYVYQNLDLHNRPENLSVRTVAEGIRRGDKNMIISASGNIMESVTAAEVPVINDIKHALIKNGADFSLMSGSGTAVFGAFSDMPTAEKAARNMHDFGQVYIG